MGKSTIILISGLVMLLLAACSSEGEQTSPAIEPTAAEAAPTSTAEPVATAEPTVEPAVEAAEADEPEPTPTPLTGVLFTYMYAVRLVDSGLYEEAVPQFNIVIKRIPELAKGWYYRGIAYRHEEQYDFALEDLNMAIELNPEFANAYKERGILYKELGEPENARADLEKALAMYDPNREARDYLETTDVLRELGN